MLVMQRQLRRRKRRTSAAAHLLAAATVAHMSLLPLPESIPLPDTICSPRVVLRREIGKSHALNDENVCRRVKHHYQHPNYHHDQSHIKLHDRHRPHSHSYPLLPLPRRATHAVWLQPCHNPNVNTTLNVEFRDTTSMRWDAHLRRDIDGQDYYRNNAGLCQHRRCQGSNPGQREHSFIPTTTGFRRQALRGGSHFVRI